MKNRLASLLALFQLSAASALPGFLSFPPGFLWGASTASHQVEGGNTNNWTVWETANAKRLADTAESRYKDLPSWPTIKSQATDPNNYISGAADDDYNRYPEDLDLAKSLGLTSYRFSLEWSRIEPKEGVFDEAAIEHYREEIRAVKAHGMEPFVTIWHWTEPTWFADLGGWQHSKAVSYFSTYAAKVAQELGTESTFWITINEPEVYAGNSYLTGTWTPQGRSPFEYFRAMNAMAAAHTKAYALLHAANPKAQVGIAHPHSYFDAGNNWFAKLLKTAADYWYNFYFLDKIRNSEDFIGLNFYIRTDLSHAPLTFSTSHLKDAPSSDLGWELYPQGMQYSLEEVYKRYRKPMYVTENGLADASDTNRSAYITSVLKGVHQALADGVDVRGYSYWSLLDNFEWSEGKWPRFGLIQVDYATQQRTIRKSAWDYADIIKQNGVSQ